jgi:hypothetical protein
MWFLIMISLCSFCFPFSSTGSKTPPIPYITEAEKCGGRCWQYVMFEFVAVNEGAPLETVPSSLPFIQYPCKTFFILFHFDKHME